MYRNLACVLCLTSPALANTQIWVAQSPNGGQTSFSAALAVASDHDQDGFPDLLVGSRYAPGGGFFQIRSGLTGALIRQVNGTGAFESLGFLLADVPDADGDGTPDVLTINQFPGEAKLYSGATGTLIRAHAGASSISGVGDWNADGRGDYVVHVDQSARLHSGLDGSVLLTITARYSGFAVPVGDVDADGTGDIGLMHIVEQPFPAQTHGRISVYSGATGVELHGFDAAPGELFGRLISVADRDGDGRRDLAVAHPDEFGSPFTSRVVVHSSANSALLSTIQNPEPVGTSFGSNFGTISLAEVGDIDLDGVPEIAAGSSFPRGLWVFSGANGTRLMAVQTPHVPIDYYIGVAGLPDIDGDGRAELVYGDPGDVNAVSSVGSLFVVRGTVDNSLGARSCFGDGTGTACPCANNGAPGQGCANTTGAGARLTAFGTASMSEADLWFLAEGLPGNASGSTYLFFGPSVVNGGNGAPSFAGLRCAGGSLRRIGQHSFKGGGVASWAPSLIEPGYMTAGVTYHFQSLYRDVASACAPANYTSLVSLTLTP